jgi:glycosyltransferase involved in cell wall biosynthesis
MKLALVVHDFDPGYGQGRYCVEIARRLAGRIPVEVHSNTWNAGTLPGVEWRRVPAWRLNVATTIATFLPFAARSLRHHPATVVHAQGLSCWSADVITAHICNAERRKHLTGSSLKARVFVGAITPLERAFYRHQRRAHLIAVSAVVRCEIETHYGWDGPASVIHHGTDTERFRPADSSAERDAARDRYGLPPGAWTWLFVGEAVKGLRETLQQLPLFPAARLLAITRSAREDYEALARQLGVADRVFLRGPETKLELAYRATDVFVYPAGYDSFALVASEAMASGLPVILGKPIGAAELVENGRNGLLCDPEDPESLHTQLNWIHSNPEAARQMGLAARSTLQQHTWANCVEATWEVYRAAVEAGSPS